MWAAIGECKSGGRRVSSRVSAASGSKSHRSCGFGRHPPQSMIVLIVAHGCICSKSAAKAPLEVAMADRPIRASRPPAVEV
jgi:hypothetical protein